MTDKRFVFEKVTPNYEMVIDKETGQSVDIINTLNYFNDKGNELGKAFLELKEENEQLKDFIQHQYDEHKRIVNLYVDRIFELENERKKLKQSETEGCENCKHATLYIPYFTFPHSDPYCEKGHGKCEVGKSCEEYRLIGSHYCNECTFWVDGVCGKKDCVMDADSESCVYFSKEVKE